MREERRNPPLSEREQQLLKLAGEGFTDTAIAHKLGISEATVGTYWGRIRIKMGPYSRTELVGMAVRAEAEATLHQLREDNERLAEQLREKANSDTKELYFQLLSDAPDAVVVVNSEGRIEFVNETLCELFRDTVDELLGSHIGMLIPERLREAHREHVEDYFWHPTKRRMGEHLDTLARRSDASEFPIAAALNLAKVGDQEHVVCVVRDVSEEEVLKRLGTPAAALQAAEE